MAEHDSSIRQTATRLRQTIRDRRRELAIAVLTSMLVALSAIGLYLVHVWSTERDVTALLEADRSRAIALASDRSRVESLRARIADANAMVAEIEAVREHGADAIRIVDAIVTHLPNGTRLSEITFGDGRISISGSADSAEAVTTFVAELEEMSGELRDVACSRNRTIGRTHTGRGRRGVERVIHAFDIRARYVRGRSSARLGPTSGENDGNLSATALVGECAAAERRVVETLEVLPGAFEPGAITDEIERLARRAGVHVEHLSAAHSPERTSYAVEGARRGIVVQCFEARVLANYGTLRCLLGEIARITPAVRIDSLVLSSTATRGRFPLEGRLRITVYHNGSLEPRGPISEEAK